MKPFILLLSVLAVMPACAAETSPDAFNERVFLAQDAEVDERFHPYPAQMIREAGNRLAGTMRRCWRLSSGKKPKPFVLVADIGPDGRPRDVAVKPAHSAAQCFAEGFSANRYLPPPAYPDRDGFPVMMRVAGGR